MAQPGFYKILHIYALERNWFRDICSKSMFYQKKKKKSQERDSLLPLKLGSREKIHGKGGNSETILKSRK